jgi:hypothetical protein
MTIIDRIQIEEQKNKRPCEEKISMFDCKETAHLRGYGLATQSEYHMKLIVGISFWANQAQYELAYKRAKRVLLHELYGDILSKIDGAIHAIYNKNELDALDNLSAIRSQLID